uniref:Kazal-like domain-containing protein n=1 Tax=Pectinophora gossypiella TaxID=13191 RepID=A0A1E1WNE1_PECGO
MTSAVQGKTVFHKFWYFLRKYVLTLKRFDLCLQGSLLVIILLESNAMLLLRRDAGTGYIQARVEDWVIVGTAIIEYILGGVLAWSGRGRRNLALAGCLAVTAICGLLVLAFPYKEATPPTVELCDGSPISAYTNPLSETKDDAKPYRITALILTVVMSSLSMISVWAHGLTYLDDHEPHNGTYFYGILISIRLSLGLSGPNWLRPGAVRDDWWVAHLALSLLTLIFAVQFTLFPKKMPDYKEIETTEDIRFIPSLVRVMKNKVFNIQVGALACLNAGLFGFIYYDRAYVQARFHIESVYNDLRTSRAISDLFRALVVIFFVMIFRVRFSDRRRDGVKANTAARVGGVVAIFVAIFFSVIAGLQCPIDDIADMNDGKWQQPQCSRDCGCDSTNYGFTPVCVLDTGTTYFSPCNAGCHGYEDINGFLLFQNCTCGAERVVRGSCSLLSCRSIFSIYQLIYTVTVAVGAAAILMQGMVLLRAVSQWDKPIAIGVALAMVSVLANVLGHFIYMLISHFTCAYLGKDGACLFHHPTLWWAAVASAILAVCSAILSLISSRVEQSSGTGVTTLEENISMEE